jgi:hypothetical protein
MLGSTEMVNNAIQTAQPTVPAPTPAPQQPAQPDLSDLTYFNNRSWGGVGEDEVNSARGKAFLDTLHKYDPNAKFSEVYGSEGNKIGYGLQFDASKLPGTSKDGGPLGYGNKSYEDGSYASGGSFMPKFSTVQDKMDLANPNAVYNTDHYGNITDNRNIIQKAGLLDYLGPLIVGGLGMAAPAMFGAMGLGMGSGASAAIGAANGGLAAAPGGMAGLNGAAPSWMLNAAKSAQSMAKGYGSTGEFNPLQVASMALPFIPGVSPTMANLGKIGLSMVGNPMRRS